MRKLLALAALVLGLASCQTEPEGLDVNVGGEVDTVVTVSLPETETRANSALGAFDNVDLSGDATIRYILKIYQKVGDEYKASTDRQVEYSDGKSVVFPVRLVPNRDYRFVVWADYVVSEADEDYHYNTADLTNVTLNDTPINPWVAMDETRDAFTGYFDTVDEGKQYTSTSSINITLTRPFAKLRVITTDMKELGYLGIEPHNAVVCYTTQFHESFNAFNGEYGAETVSKTHTYTIADYADQTGANKVLFTDYFFADDSDVVKFVMNVNEANNALIKSNNFNTDIAVKRNHLTTIQGNILTDGNNVTVTVDDAFANAGNLEDEPYFVEIWDGKSIEAPELVTDPTTGEDYYSVENGSELAWLAAAVNGTLETRAVDADNFAGKTFKLTQDIDLGGNEWTPISMPTELSPSNTFRGTFDGQGHTIKGLYVRQQEAAGLFGYVYAATIKNVTIEGANLYSNHYAGGVVAWVLNNKGNIKVPFVMENCHVKNSTISSTPALINGEWDNGDKVGGLVGYVLFDNEGAVIKNCSVENTSIKAYRDFGGFAGYAKGVAFENCAISNVTLEQDLTHDYKAPDTPTTYDLYIGRNEGGNTIDGAEMVANGVLKTGENEYGIYGAQGLKWIADVVNTTTPYTATLFDNATVKLMNDIDLNNQEWIPIGDDRFERTEWHGVFDGQGYTVKNIKITKKTDRDDANKSSYGLFGNVEGTVKNLTVENVSISGAPKFIGALIGRLNGGLVENCHVKDSSVECENWTIGGLVGQFNNGKISGCTVENTTVKGYAAVGGITGIALTTGERVIENCSINGCTFVQNGSFGGDYDKMFGTIVGALYSGGLKVNLNECTSSNNTLDGNAYSIPCGFISNGDTLLVDGYEMVANGVGLKDGEYYVMSAQGLVWVEAQEDKYFAGKTIKLANDIDMTGVTIANPIIFWDGRTTFDGQNYTISNLTMSTDSTEKKPFSLFGGTADIKNVKFDNANISGYSYVAVVAGNLYGNIDNCHVSNSRVTCTYWMAGAMSGQYNAGNVTNCSVTNTTITGPAAVGALVGNINETAGIRCVENCTVKGCTIAQNGSFGGDYDQMFGAVVGLINIENSIVNFSNCTVENTTVKGVNSDALYGCDGGNNTVGEDMVIAKSADDIVNAQAGETITVASDITLAEEVAIPAGVIFNGNGKQINGTLYAGGDVTFVGHTKVTAFSASYYDRTITIGEGACLEITGTGRMSLAYGNTFDITGNIENAKSADMTNIQPSLIIPGGISITGGNDAVFNIKNAYVKIGSTSSKNNSANGIFTINIENSIAEFTSQLTFAEPTSGMNPTFNLNVKNSVLTTGTKLILAAKNCNMVVDNSTINVESYFRNSGTVELKNGSVLNGNTIQFGENGGHDGVTVVDNSEFTIIGGSTGQAYDGRGVGSITFRNGAEGYVDYYKALTINTDATSTFTGTEVF